MPDPGAADWRCRPHAMPTSCHAQAENMIRLGQRRALVFRCRHCAGPVIAPSHAIQAHCAYCGLSGPVPQDEIPCLAIALARLGARFRALVHGGNVS